MIGPSQTKRARAADARHPPPLHRAGSGLVLALALLLLSPVTASAGPWTPEPGHGYGKLWVKWLHGVGYHAGDGSTVAYGTYNELFVATYGEVGLVDGLAAIWHTDLVRLFSLADPRTEQTETHVAPGDPALGLRWRFVDAERFAMAVEATARAPLATADPVQEVATDEMGNAVIGELRTGSGAWDFAGQLSAGYGWDDVYVAAAGGWIARTNGYDHAAQWTVEGGGTFSGAPISLRARITGVHPIDTGSAPRHESPSGLGNGTSYIGFAAEGDWQVQPGWFIGITFEGGILAVRRQTGGPVISLFGATKF